LRENDETPAEDDDAGETVVVDRAPAVEEGTVVIDRGPALEEGTVVIDRARAVEEGTVVIDRAAPVDDGTLVIDRSAADEGTIAIEGRRDRARRPAPRSSSVLGALPRRGQRRELREAPGGPAANRTAVLASGPGAVSTYLPRAIPAPPAPRTIPEAGAEATRADAPRLPSVSRSSTRWSRTALAAFACACAISIAGLVILLVLVTAG
jgi:hypothetical protein